jgi:hypothetical protein
VLGSPPSGVVDELPRANRELGIGIEPELDLSTL